MKFSGKMCLMITLKVTKNQGFTLFLKDTVFEKPQRGVQLPPPPPFPPVFLELVFSFIENQNLSINFYGNISI